MRILPKMLVRKTRCCAFAMRRTRRPWRSLRPQPKFRSPKGMKRGRKEARMEAARTMFFCACSFVLYREQATTEKHRPIGPFICSAIDGEHTYDPIPRGCGSATCQGQVVRQDRWIPSTICLIVVWCTAFRRQDRSHPHKRGTPNSHHEELGAAFGRNRNSGRRKKRNGAKGGRNGGNSHDVLLCVFFRSFRPCSSAFFRCFLSERQDVAALQYRGRATAVGWTPSTVFVSVKSVD